MSDPTWSGLAGRSKRNQTERIEKLCQLGIQHKNASPRRPAPSSGRHTDGFRPNVAGNLSEARRLIAKAVEQGARLVVLPEFFAIMGMTDRTKSGARAGGQGRSNHSSAKLPQYKIWRGRLDPLRQMHRTRSECLSGVR